MKAIASTSPIDLLVDADQEPLIHVVGLDWKI